MNVLLAIAAGGALGALLRYGLSGLVQKMAGGAFPWGTLTVNVIGSLAIGICWELFNRSPTSPALRGFAVVGLLGAFTTFSTFSLETVVLSRVHDLRMALLNVATSNVVCITAAFLGLAAARWLLAETPK